MTTSVKVRFDGKVFVPQGPVNLPVGCVLDAQVTPAADSAKAPLERLLEVVGEIAAPEELPADGAAQHDHYLYGTPKR